MITEKRKLFFSFFLMHSTPWVSVTEGIYLSVLMASAHLSCVLRFTLATAT